MTTTKLDLDWKLGITFITTHTRKTGRTTGAADESNQTEIIKLAIGLWIELSWIWIERPSRQTVL
jgi:hypothetical protein